MLPALHQFRREGQAAQERAEAVITLSYRAGVSGPVGVGDYPAGLGAGRAGTERGRDCADTPGPGRLPGHRGRAVTTVFSCPAGRGVWESGAGRRRADRAGRGAGSSGQNWGALLRGGAVSAEGRADASAVTRSNSLTSPKVEEKPKRVFSKPSRLPAANKRSRWSCGR